MAHMISTHNGRHEMAYSGETPWHGLGARVAGLATTRPSLEDLFVELTGEGFDVDG